MFVSRQQADIGQLQTSEPDLIDRCPLKRVLTSACGVNYSKDIALTGIPRQIELT